MAQRIGLRINPTSGTETLGLPLDASGFGLRLLGTVPYEYVSPDVDSNGGGSSAFFGPFGARSGLQKSTSSGAPWTIWFDPIPGTYTGFAVDELDANTGLPDVQFRLILETDSVEGLIGSQTTTALEGAGGTTYAAASVSVAFTIGSVAPSSFWTDFEKTRENAP